MAASITLAAVGTIAPAAYAKAPEQRVDHLSFAFPDWADCSNYGGTGLISAAGSIERRVQIWTAADGSVKEVRHVHFTGTLTGAGGTATYEGSFRVVFEDPAGVFQSTGQTKFHLPGRQAPLVVAGRRLQVGDELVMVTPKAVPFDGERAVCEAIGG